MQRSGDLARCDDLKHEEGFQGHYDIEARARPFRPFYLRPVERTIKQG